jgi:hypothetical protein
MSEEVGRKVKPGVKGSIMINHNAITFLLRCGPEGAIFVASKMVATIEKSKQKRALHCG